MKNNEFTLLLPPDYSAELLAAASEDELHAAELELSAKIMKVDGISFYMKMQFERIEMEIKRRKGE